MTRRTLQARRRLPEPGPQRGRVSVVVLLGLAILLLPAGCGSSTESTTEESDEPTLEEWVREADAICGRYDEEFANLEEPEVEEDLADFAQTVGELASRQSAELRGLRIPEEKAELVESFLDLGDERAELNDQFLTSSDEAAAQDAFEESDAIRDEVLDLADEIGLVECGSGD